MKLIGNYKSFITKELMEYLDSLETGVVKIWDPNRWENHPARDFYKKMENTNYSKRDDQYQQFFKFSDEMKNINLPEFPGKRKQEFWWLVKIKPGQFQPVHFDPHLTGAVNPLRCTMFLQDWEPGHIYVYNDKMITDYKAGDIFMWDDEWQMHGVANIGYNTRYTIQIAMYDSIDESIARGGFVNKK